MERHLKHNSGFLLIAAAILIVILSGVAVLIVDSFTKQANIKTNQLFSNQANAIAISALGIVKHDIKENSLTCSAITGNAKYTNASLFNGQFTVTGSEDATTNTLASNINSSSTSITLANASTFASSGIVEIGSEIISYQNKNGNALEEITRGSGGTPIADHSSGTIVTQNQCLLSAIGAVPSIINPKGKHTIEQAIKINSEAFNLPGGPPGLLSAGAVSLSGTSGVINSWTTSSSANFAGSTVMSGGPVSLSGNAETEIGDGNGGTVVSSDASTPNADIMDNILSLNHTTLFNLFFDDTEDHIEGDADTSYNAGNLNGAEGKTIWINGNLSITGGGSMTIGSPTHPVILIVNGNFRVTSGKDITLYGLMYVTGTIFMAGGGDFDGSGMIAAEGSISLSGNKEIAFDPTIINLLSDINSNIITNNTIKRYTFNSVYA